MRPRCSTRGPAPAGLGMQNLWPAPAAASEPALEGEPQVVSRHPAPLDTQDMPSRGVLGIVGCPPHPWPLPTKCQWIPVASPSCHAPHVSPDAPKRPLRVVVPVGRGPLRWCRALSPFQGTPSAVLSPKYLESPRPACPSPSTFHSPSPPTGGLVGFGPVRRADEKMRGDWGEPGRASFSFSKVYFLLSGWRWF